MMVSYHGQCDQLYWFWIWRRKKTRLYLEGGICCLWKFAAIGCPWLELPDQSLVGGWTFCRIFPIFVAAIFAREIGVISITSQPASFGNLRVLAEQTKRLQPQPPVGESSLFVILLIEFAGWSPIFIDFLIFDFVIFYFTQGINVLMLVDSCTYQNMCTSTITYNCASTKRVTVFLNNLASCIRRIALMQFKLKKDWTGDNSCPYKVRSKKCFQCNDI